MGKTQVTVVVGVPGGGYVTSGTQGFLYFNNQYSYIGINC